MKAALAALVLLVPYFVAEVTTAQTSGAATVEDLQRLQESLANLDDVLAALPPGDSKTEEFRGRAEQIRDETIYLKVKMEHHQRDVGAGTGLTVAEVADVRHRVDILKPKAKHR